MKKHKAFETEKEIRLATWDYYNDMNQKVSLADCTENEQIVQNGFDHRVNEDGRIILYKKFYINKEALVGIIVHAYSKIEYQSIKKKYKSILIAKAYRRQVYENIYNTQAYPFNI